MLTHPSLDREPGHRRQATVKLTGDRPLSLARPVRHAVWPQRRFLPRSRWQVGPQRRRHPHAPRRPRPPSLMGRRWAVRTPARARARGGPKALSPAQERRNPFSFSFSTLFPFLNSVLNILCTKDYQKGFPRSHTIMMLENDTL
jgi:hypothetical protein